MTAPSEPVVEKRLVGGDNRRLCDALVMARPRLRRRNVGLGRIIETYQGGLACEGSTTCCQYRKALKYKYSMRGRSGFVSTVVEAKASSPRRRFAHREGVRCSRCGSRLRVPTRGPWPARCAAARSRAPFRSVSRTHIEGVGAGSAGAHAYTATSSRGLLSSWIKPSAMGPSPVCPS
jgi:hypothetical protein